MKTLQRLVILLSLLLVIAITSPAQITVSQSQFSSYFDIGRPIQFLVDARVFAVDTQKVNVGQKGGPHVYDFSNAILVEFGLDTLYSVSEDPFLAQRFAPELFTFKLPQGDEDEEIEYPVISVTSELFSTVGNYRIWTADSVRIRHNDPEPIFYFPVTLGDSVRAVIASVETTYVSGTPMDIYSYADTVNVVVDGWGTLKLPGGLEYDVLRVRDTEETVDSMDWGGTEFRFITNGGGMLFVSAAKDQPDTGVVVLDGPIEYIINPSITSVEVHEPITVSKSEFESYFSVGSPISILVDTTIFSSQTPMVNIGRQGGPNVYNFSDATLVEYVNDTLLSVSTNDFLAERFAPEYFTFELPIEEEGVEGFENPILAINDTSFSIVGQYRSWTGDSTGVRYSSPAEVIFHFPVEYEDFIETMIMYAETLFVSDNPVETNSYQRTQNVFVDGWGTLILPDGQHDVLRIRDTDDDEFSGKSIRFLTKDAGMLFVEVKGNQPDTGWVEVEAPIQYVINPAVISSSEVPREIPSGFELAQNYPNPFNPSTSIRYSLPVRAKVRLTVYNILGQELAVLDEGEKLVGWHTVQWNAVSQPSGIYFVRLQAGSFVSTRKVVLLK